MLIRAIRDIKKGEEVTVDYGSNYRDDENFRMECKCAKSRCSGWIGMKKDDVKKMRKEEPVSFRDLQQQMQSESDLSAGMMNMSIDDEEDQENESQEQEDQEKDDDGNQDQGDGAHEDEDDDDLDERIKILEQMVKDDDDGDETEIEDEDDIDEAAAGEDDQSENEHVNEEDERMAAFKERMVKWDEESVARSGAGRGKRSLIDCAWCKEKSMNKQAVQYHVLRKHPEEAVKVMTWWCSYAKWTNLPAFVKKEFKKKQKNCEYVNGKLIFSDI